MNRNRDLWKVPASVIIPFLALAVLHLLLGGELLWRVFTLSGITVASLCASAGIIFSRFRLSIEDGRPEEVLSQLAHSLRVSGFSVKEGKHLLTISLNSLAAVRIKAKPADGKTVVSYSPYATETGWVVWIIVNFMTGYGALLGLVLAFYLFVKARTMAHSRVLPRLGSTGAIHRREDERGTSQILVDCLSEGRRMAKEAYEAAKSSYEDLIIVVVIVSGILFGVAFLVLSETLIEGGSTEQRILLAIGLSMAISVGFGATVITRLRKTRKKQLAEIRVWEERLGRALMAETSALSQGVIGDEPSTLELLLEASLQIPVWEKARVRGSLYSYPGTSLSIACCCVLAFMGLFILALGEGDLAMYSGAGMAAGGIAGIILLYLQWRKEVREDHSRFSEDWQKRMTALDSNFERFVKGM